MGRNRKIAGIAAGIGLATASALAVQVTTTGASSSIGHAELRNQAGDVVGEVVFKRREGEIVGQAEVTVPASSAEFHGFHIHQNAADGNGCIGDFTAAGGHWNPGATTHGSHAGDMPVLMRDANGHAETEFVVGKFEPNDIIGRAVIVHLGPDNYANIPVTPYGGPVGTTLATGDAGSRYACGVVEPLGG